MLQMALFCLAYGRDLEDLKVYYTNYDNGKWITGWAWDRVGET